jgi:Cof subfamily protein (haloacid dehalogenase superfamily)
MVAMDLDDTVLNDRQELTDRTISALRGAMDKGVEVVFASGRMYSAMLPYALKAGLTAPLLCCQGAIIKSVPDGEIIAHTPIGLDEAFEVLRAARELNAYVQYYIDDNYYYDHDCEESEYYSKIGRVTGKAVGRLEDFMEQPPTKMLFIATPERTRALSDIMNERMGGRLAVAISKARYLEFTHPDANKGNALRALAAKKNIPLDEVMAIGDSFNDLSMLNIAGVSVAMGNASDAIKQKCTLTADTNENDGVAKVIEQYILGR